MKILIGISIYLAIALPIIYLFGGMARHGRGTSN